MNRDELLTKLAMELEEWYFGDFSDPSTDHKIPKLPKEVAGITHEFEGTELTLRADVGQPIKENEWLQRRTELINKPSWDDAPEWAQWLAQDANGEWYWNENKPEHDHSGWVMEYETTEAQELASEGAIPTGHDWRETLEARPDFDESRADAIGQNGNEGLHYDEDQCAERVFAPNYWGKVRCVHCGKKPPAEDSDSESALSRALSDTKQARYTDANGDDWIDEFARTASAEEFRGAMRFTIGKYNRQMGRKDDIAQEVRKMRDYCDRWLDYEDRRP